MDTRHLYQKRNWGSSVLNWKSRYQNMTSLFFLNRRTKQLFLAVTVNDFNKLVIFYENNFAVAPRSHELSRHRIFSAILIGVSFSSNLFRFYMFFFFSCIYILRIVLPSMNVVLNLFNIQNHIIGFHYANHNHSVWS